MSPKKTQNLQADQKNVSNNDVKKEAAKKVGFFDSLKNYLTSGTTIDVKAIEEKQKKKKVRMEKKAGLSLLATRFARLSRSGALGDGAPKTIKEAASTITAEKRVTDTNKTEKKATKSDVVEREKNRQKKDAGIGIFDLKKKDIPQEENVVGDIAVKKESNNDSEALPDEYYVDIPDSLLKDLEELETVAQSISKEEIEQAANFLGVFEGSVDLTKFKDYAPVDDSPKKKPSTKKKDSTEKKKKTDATKKDTSSSKDESLNISQFKSFFDQQKKLMSKISGIANLPIFDPEKFKQLMTALPALQKQAENAAANPAQAQNQSAAAPVATAPVAQNETVAANQTQSTAVQPQDPTTVSGPIVAASDEAALTKEMQSEGVLEVKQPEEKKGFSLFGRKKVAKETEAEIKKNMGIDLSSTTKEEATKKIDLSALETEVGNEGFLESTTGSIEQKSLSEIESSAPPQKELSSKEKKALEKKLQQEAKEKAEIDAKKAKQDAKQNKLWAEEAKKREKQLKEMEKKQKEEDKLRKKGKKAERVKIKIPKAQKKKGGFSSFMQKLNYMGMSKEKDAFIDNLAVMMDAGLQLLDGVRTLEMETKNKAYKKIMSQIVVAIETGSPLWRAMDSTNFFEQQQVAMVQVGEEAGNLIENLKHLAVQSAKQRELKGKIKTAMIYPVIVLTMLMIIVTGLGMFVLPNLIQVIISLGAPLPFVTRMIVKFTDLLTQHGAIFIPGMFGSAIMIVLLHKFTSFKVVTQWIIMKVPGIGPLLVEATLSQFGVTMAGLLQAGVPVTDSLESLANVTSVARYKKFYYLLLQRVKLGDSFSTAFSNIKMSDKCFPTSMQQLILTGEKSGSLVKVMEKLAEIHDKKATEIAEKLPVILEPMLLLFIGSLVGTIALGVLAPIYSVVGNIG